MTFLIIIATNFFRVGDSSVSEKRERFEFQLYFKGSKTLHLCRREILKKLSCDAFINSDPNNYFSHSHKADHPALYFTVSMSPNGKDVWMSGGRGVAITKDSMFTKIDSVFIEDRITVMR